MKLLISICLSLLVGYLIGNRFPIEDLVNPLKSVRLKEDVVLKAGTVGKVRTLRVESAINLPVEFEVDFNVSKALIDEAIHH
jgi:hypothetical protein